MCGPAIWACEAARHAIALQKMRHHATHRLHDPYRSTSATASARETLPETEDVTEEQKVQDIFGGLGQYRSTDAQAAPLLQPSHSHDRPTRGGAEGSTCQLLCLDAFLGGTMEESKKVVPRSTFWGNELAKNHGRFAGVGGHKFVTPICVCGGPGKKRLSSF